MTKGGTTFSSEREAEYISAALGEPTDAQFNNEGLSQIAWVRRLFVERLGWDRTQLARYPFPALAEVARPGDWRLALLKGCGDHAAILPEEMLHLTLRQVANLPHRQRRGYAESALLPQTPEVLELGQGHRAARSRFTEADRTFVLKTAATNGIVISERDERTGGAEFTEAVMKLLRLAYEVR